MLAMLLMGVPPGALSAGEREFGTIVALGGIVPIASSQGQSSTVLVWDQERRELPGRGTFRGKLLTTELSLAMEHALGEQWRGDYGLRGEAITEGYGMDLYTRGRRLAESGFQGDSQGAEAGLGWQVSDTARLHWRASRSHQRFRRAKTAAKNTAPPRNFTRNRFQWDFSWQPTPARGLALNVTSEERPDWSKESQSPFGVADGQSMGWSTRWSQQYAWAPSQQTQARISAVGGSNLDLFNDIRVGGLAGAETVAGYYRNEFRSRAAYLINLSHESAPAEDRRFSLYADLARVRLLGLPFQAGEEEWRTLAGVGVGYRHGIRSLAGLPLILRFGEGLLVPSDSLEKHRREFLLIAAAGF